MTIYEKKFMMMIYEKRFTMMIQKSIYKKCFCSMFEKIYVQKELKLDSFDKGLWKWPTPGKGGPYWARLAHPLFYKMFSGDRVL